MPYITKAIEGLKRLDEQGVKQIVFNRNYGETIDSYRVKGHLEIPDLNEFVLHNHHEDPVKYINCHYWPHYSFRPSIIDVKSILEVGNYDSPNDFFEMDYAKKWTQSGFKTAFFNRITHIHTGRLTKDRFDKSKKNAYSLNNTIQFDGTKQTIPTIKVINLKRRTDRKEKTIKKLVDAGIDNYEFFEAIDGKTLKPSIGLEKLFADNDFGNRKGVIGCAMSHFLIWANLVADKENDYYVIMEDDFTLCENFKNKFESLTPYFREKDFVFLGYHMFSYKKKEFLDLYYNNNEDVHIEPLNKDLYIGGIHCYSINKRGAKKLLDYIGSME
jgi:hypothetical protein